jgi:hypothetical protein
MPVGPAASGRLMAETAAGDEADGTGRRSAATEAVRPCDDSRGADEGFEAVPLMAMPVAATMPEGRPGPESHGTSDSHTMGRVMLRRLFAKSAIVPDSHGCTESASPRPGRRNRITSLSHDNTKPGNTGHAKTGRHGSIGRRGRASRMVAVLRKTYFLSRGCFQQAPGGPGRAPPFRAERADARLAPPTRGGHAAEDPHDGRHGCRGCAIGSSGVPPRVTRYMQGMRPARSVRRTDILPHECVRNVKRIACQDQVFNRSDLLSGQAKERVPRAAVARDSFPLPRPAFRKTPR